jgi:hypothetical protein
MGRLPRDDGSSDREADAMADDLTVTRDGDTLVIRIPIKAPTPSSSGKTLVVASTRGNQKTGVQIDGKDLYLGLNAYVYAEPKATK